MLMLRALRTRTMLSPCPGLHRPGVRRLQDESPHDKYSVEIDGTNLSKLYKQARPMLPECVIQDVVAYVKQKLEKQELCVDVGCGPGTSTELFCPYFQNVVGVDVSHSVIEEANANRVCGNVTYMEAHAENMPLRSQSVALVAAVNAIQWFDQDAFFAEVRRVLLDNGVLFAAMHHLRTILEPGVDHSLLEVRTCYSAVHEVYGAKFVEHDELRKDKMSDYLLSRHSYWEDGYDNLEVPFKGVRRKTRLVKGVLKLSAVMAHINTWSLVTMMRQQEPDRAEATLAEFKDRVLEKIGRYPGDDPVMNVGFMTSYVMCRK